MRLGELVVKQAPHVDMGKSNLSIKSFPMVFVKQPSVSKFEEMGQTPLDEFFSQRSDVEKKSADPNYADLFKQTALITGFSSETGVFLNGGFYRTGDKIEALAMTATSGLRIVPVVESVTSDGVVFRVGQQNVTLKAKR